MSSTDEHIENNDIPNQFLEDVDYVLAFKSLSEKSNRAVSFSDAMDAYYDCIWDPTLLEFIIHQHSRKGEHKRKQQAVMLIDGRHMQKKNIIFVDFRYCRLP